MRRFLSIAAAAMALAISAAAGPARSASAPDLDEGRQVYRHTCIVCHGATGKGTFPGMPDFRQKGGVLSQKDGVLLDRIEHGFRSAGASMAMPPKGGNPSLTERQLEDVLAYLHRTFGVASASADGANAGTGPAGNAASAHAGGMDRGMMGPGMGGGGMMAR